MRDITPEQLSKEYKVLIPIIWRLMKIPYTRLSMIEMSFPSTQESSKFFDKLLLCKDRYINDSDFYVPTSVSLDVIPISLPSGGVLSIDIETYQATVVK